MGVRIKQEKPPQPLSFTGERLTSAVSGQIEIEHLHRYLMARELCCGKDVLDVACGEGYGAAMLAQVARSVTGVDIDFGAIAHASRAYSRGHLRFAVGNARSLPLADACIDIVVSFETLEHLSEQEEFLAEVRRVMRPGGLLVISTPDRDLYSGAGERANPFHERELSREEFVKLLAREFKHVAFYGQRPVIGSVLMPESETGAIRRPITFEKLDRDHLERCDELPRALYLVAIASDREIQDEFPGSFYIDSGEVQAELGFDRTAARAQILELRAGLYGWTAETDRLRTELTQVRERLASETSRLKGELAQAYERLESETNRLMAELTQAREQIRLRGMARRLSGRLRQISRKIAEVIQQTWHSLKRTPVFSGFHRLSQIWRSPQTSQDVELITSSGLFDRDWYLSRYADVREAGHDAALHYLLQGGAEGRDPGPSFDSKWYLEENPDVRAGGDNPLVHYLRHGAAEGRAPNQMARDVQLITASGLFDRDWYLARYADVREAGDDAALHYLLHGGAEGRDPGPQFESSRYLAENPDVRASGTNPLVHYLRHGVAEVRTLNRTAEDIALITSSGLFDRDWYLGQYTDVREAGDDGALHYLVHGGAEGRDPGPLFDSDWYLDQNPDVRASGANPLVHYLRHGMSESRDPNPLFDTDWYLAQNPDVQCAGIEPLAHYFQTGAAEGRDPSPRFNTRWYVSANPEVAAAGANPLAHYLEWGLPEGRPAHEPRQYLRSTVTQEPRCDIAVTSRPSLRRWRRPQQTNPGVNLIGPVEFVSGLSVSARGFAASLMHAGIPLNVIPWRIGFQRLRPAPVDLPSRELQPINLIHLNLDLMQDRHLLDIPPLAEIASPDRYNIAIVYWELAAVPSEWVDLIHRFDEIWCASSFMAHSIATVSSRPVRIVPPAINPPSAPRQLTRADFGLPQERFIFAYVADAASQLGRKNPRSLIEAYAEEFAPDEGACCVIKLGYSNPYGAETRAMRAMAARRPDIIMIDRQLGEKELSELYELIDCYVSPHRSEGLGLTILEAMNAGKPVIATPYGGVSDFVTRDTASAISYRLIEVGPGRVPYPRHAVWADPMKSSLRSAMRAMFSDRDLAASLGLKGHAFARNMFSLDATACRVRAELDRIWVAGGGRTAGPETGGKPTVSEHRNVVSSLPGGPK
jgi:glycosyltransferase involved in cell wall biosynthesis/ubiquinone/menaquinone biosynthesis C-methylase UbiE